MLCSICNPILNCNELPDNSRLKAMIDEVCSFVNFESL